MRGRTEMRMAKILGKNNRPHLSFSHGGSTAILLFYSLLAGDRVGITLRSLLYSHIGGGQINTARIGTNRAASMALSWIHNPTDQDRLLLKDQIMSTVSGVRITTSI